MPVQRGFRLGDIGGVKTVGLCAGDTVDADIVHGGGEVAVPVEIPAVVVPVEDDLLGGAGHVVQDDIEVGPVGYVGDIPQVVEQRDPVRRAGRGHGRIGVDHIHLQVVEFRVVAGLAYDAVVEGEVIFHLVVGEHHVDGGIGIGDAVGVDVGGAAVGGDVDGVREVVRKGVERWQPGGGAEHPLVDSRAGEGEGLQGNGGVTLEVFEVGQGGRRGECGEIDGVQIALLVVDADHGDVGAVVGGIVQIGEGVEGVSGGAVEHLRAVGQAEKRDVVAVGGTDGIGMPVDGHIRAEDLLHGEVLHRRAHRRLVQDEVVDADHAVSRDGQLQGDVVTGAGVVGEVGRVFHVGAVGVRRDDGLHRREGGHIRGVVHHTDHKVAGVGVDPAPELEHHVGHVVGRGEFGQDETGHLGRGVVEEEVVRHEVLFAGVRRSVRAARNLRIVLSVGHERHRVGVIARPDGTEFEPLGVRKRGDGAVALRQNRRPEAECRKEA